MINRRYFLNGLLIAPLISIPTYASKGFFKGDVVAISPVRQFAKNGVLINEVSVTYEVFRGTHYTYHIYEKQWPHNPNRMELIAVSSDGKSEFYADYSGNSQIFWGYERDGNKYIDKISTIAEFVDGMWVQPGTNGRFS